MEATGVYWLPVFDVLERRFECWLLNAQHLHNVPGRKTDTIDSAWICQLVEHGSSGRASCRRRRSAACAT
jgi:transposase